MPRKPTETVQINLRIKEAERRQLEASAKERQISMNAEITMRLAQTFQQQQLLDVDLAHENMKRELGPMLVDINELNRSSELTRAVDILIRHIQPLLAARIIDGPTGQAIREDIEAIRLAESAIEHAIGKRVRRMR